MKVTGSEAGAAKKNRVLLEAGLHGNEVANPEYLVRLAEWLATEYQHDNAEVRQLLDQNELHLVPAVNPDGVDAGTRWNAHHVDLNRNGDPQHWGRDDGSSSNPSSSNYRGPRAMSEPETRAFDALVRELRPNVVLDLHSSGSHALYPYAWTEAPIEGVEGARFRGLAEDLAKATGHLGFKAQQGGAFGHASGEITDHLWSEHRIPAITIESGSKHDPNNAERNLIFERVIKPMVAYLGRIAENPLVLAETQDP
jgi:predicted deacylase